MNRARAEAMRAVTTENVVDWWSTAISDIEPGVIRFCGYPIQQLIGRVSFPDMIWLLLRGDLPKPWQAGLLEVALVAAVDHGPQAPSIAAARMAVTCGVGINHAMATGVNLLGDVHGGAGQQCMDVLAGICEAVESGDSSVPDVVARVLTSYRASGRFVPGFGHRFHPRDPRRDPLLNAVQQQVDDGNLEGAFLEAALELEVQLAVGRSKPVPMNIDGATAVIFSELGFDSELGRGLFVLSRSVGVLAHAWEETQQTGRIKGPIPPPLLPSYRGPAPRDAPGHR